MFLTLMNLACFIRGCHKKKTLDLKKEKCNGGKHRKIKLRMAAASMIGVKLSMFVIGKAKNPRCFKEIKKPSCSYRSQTESWRRGKGRISKRR